MSSRLVGTEGWSCDPPAAAPGPPLPARCWISAAAANWCFNWRSSSIFSPLFFFPLFFFFFLANKVNTRGRFEPLIPALYSKENKP